MEVTNEDRATPKTVTIAQYPLEYITNILGWYSYRDDFEGTTYELLKGEDVKGKTYTSSNRIQDWICGCTWSSRNNSWSYDSDETGFFGFESGRNGCIFRSICWIGSYLLLQMEGN